MSSGTKKYNFAGSTGYVLFSFPFSFFFFRGDFFVRLPKVSSIPMFWVNKESGWLQLRWRCNDGCVQDVDERAESAYQRMDAVARGKTTQLVISLARHEILVVDNRAIAHGRRSFECTEPRVMWRRNYVGDGELAADMRVGLCQAYSSVFEHCHSVFDPL